MPKHVLHQDYQRMISAGMKPNLARITVARKIAAAVLAMWKNKEEYDPAKSQQADLLRSGDALDELDDHL